MGGRWVEARDLRQGDVLSDRSGRGLVVTSLSSRQQKTEVFNLQIEGHHTYAVRREGILVHNKGAKEAPSLTALGVTVYGRVTLEHYEVSILGATGASPLLRWLREKSYDVSAAADSVLDTYIGQNWSFVAVKLNPNEKRPYENEFLPPLTIRYRHDRLVFPLRISSISTAQSAKITLYVIAESTVSSTNLPTVSLVLEETIPDSVDPENYVERRIRESAGSEGRGLVVIWKGKHPPSVALDELMENPFPAGVTSYLTGLEARMDPGAMTEDIALSVGPAPARFGIQFRTAPIGPAPSQAKRVSGVAVIAPAGHTVALKGDGTLWA